MSKKGLIESFNALREEGSIDFQKNVPELTEDSNIEVFVTPLLQYPKLYNEFCDMLVQKLVYTQFLTKKMKNPLKVLEGDKMPLGYIGEEIYVNPAIGRDYDIDDFAGLLKKYEADVKVQYQGINFDKQYIVTVIRTKLKQAFTTWDSLGEFITQMTQSLYNGFYIDEFNNTKAIVTRAYLSNAVQIEVCQKPTTTNLAKAFVKLARNLYLNFQVPSHKYNAWSKVGGYGRAIETLTDPDDIYFLVRNDIRTEIDVEQLASAFNISKTDLMGRIIPIDDFNIYDRKTGKLMLDGSNIHAIICDKAWFRIKPQDEFMDDFKNANNRSIQYYLNEIKMFNYSFFANAVVLASAIPDIAITNLEFKEQTVTLKVGETKEVSVIPTPNNGNTPITFSTTSELFTVTQDADNPRKFVIEGIEAGTGTITATAGNVTTTLNVTIEE